MPTIRLSRDVAANIADHNPMPVTSEGLIIEAWSQGYLVGSLIIMTFITLANMRRGVLLHKVPADFSRQDGSAANSILR